MTTTGKVSLTFLLLLLGFSSGVADPVRQSDISADSSWAAHIDLRNLDDSPLSAVLLEIAGFDRILKLRDAFKQHLSLDLHAVGSVTLFGSGDRSQETAMVLRGSFDNLVLADLAVPAGDSIYRGVQLQQGPDWQGSTLYLARSSDTELVAGTSPEAIRDAIDLLQGGKQSWDGIALADHAARELKSTTALLALDMKKIGNELQFEADFTRAIRKAWFLVASSGDNVEATILVDSTDAEGLVYLQSQLQFLIAMLASQPDVPAEWAELTAGLKVETKDNWMTARVSTSPEKAAGLLKSLGPLFQKDPEQPDPAH